MAAGIYAIRNKLNGKVYIGYTVDFDMRKSTHWHNLCNDKGVPNKHLQSAWNKYGEESFEFEIIEEVNDLSNIEKIEQAYIEEWETNKREKGYNKRIESRSNLGIVWDSETRARMSESHSGDKCYWWGREFTEEHKQNISDGRLGITAWNKGKTHLVGANNPRAILNESQVLDIRESLRSGSRGTDLAKEYGVSKYVISKIKTGKTWASVG